MLRHFGVFFSAMKVRHVRWLLFTVLPILLVLDFVTSPRVVGMSEQWSNDQYRFAGGTAPLGLAIGALVFGLYLLLMYADPAELGPPFSGVFRRFVAFWMDFIVAMTVMAPVLGVIVALIEWRRTGVFQWAFERETQAPDDRILAPAGTALVAVAVVFYYALPLLRRRPSSITFVPETKSIRSFYPSVKRRNSAWRRTRCCCGSPPMRRSEHMLWFR